MAVSYNSLAISLNENILSLVIYFDFAKAFDCATTGHDDNKLKMLV